MSDNKITDNGLQAIIEACHKNPNLKEVIIDDINDITEPYKNRLRAALKKN